MTRSVLRSFVFAVAAALTIAGLYSIGTYGLTGPGLQLLGAGLIVGGSLLVERWRYRRLGHRPPGPGWQETGERFVDPETGNRVSVYHNPATGERRYVSS